MKLLNFADTASCKSLSTRYSHKTSLSLHVTDPLKVCLHYDNDSVFKILAKLPMLEPKIFEHLVPDIINALQTKNLELRLLRP